MMKRARASASCVILQTRSAVPNRLAVEAAFDLARGLRFELQSLFVEDERLFSLACLPCAREVTIGGRPSGALSLERLQQEMRLAASAVRREFERLAKAAEVPFRFGIVRDDPAAALDNCCRQGAILTFAEPVGAYEVARIAGLMAGERGLGGVMLVGPRGRRRSGPIVMAVERLEDVGELLRLSEQLRSPVHRRIVVLLLAEDRARLARLEADTRRMIGSTSQTQLAMAETSRGTAAVIASALDRSAGGLLVTRLSGELAPESRQLALLIAAIECPALLMR